METHCQETQTCRDRYIDADCWYRGGYRDRDREILGQTKAETDVDMDLDRETRTDTDMDTWTQRDRYRYGYIDIHMNRDI